MTALFSRGDILKRPKFPVTHYGVALSESEILEICPEHGCRVTDIEGFAKDKKYQVIQREPVSGFEERAFEVIEGKYNLLLNNCEHVANYVCRGRKKSVQLRTVVSTVSLAMSLGTGTLWARLLVGAGVGLLASKL